jgi:hypothetical protein
MNKKKIEEVFTSKFVGTGPSSYKKIIYRAAVSQRLRNTGLCGAGNFRLNLVWTGNSVNNKEWIDMCIITCINLPAYFFIYHEPKNTLTGKTNSRCNSQHRLMCRWFYDMIIYLSIAIGLTPGGSSTVHIYTQTIHRTTQKITFTCLQYDLRM